MATLEGSDAQARLVRRGVTGFYQILKFVEGDSKVCAGRVQHHLRAWILMYCNVGIQLGFQRRDHALTRYGPSSMNAQTTSKLLLPSTTTWPIICFTCLSRRCVTAELPA